jgi:Ca-activated chloride channel family protein
MTMKKVLAKIAVSGTITFMVILLIVAGIQFFSSFQGSPTLDLMTAQSTESTAITGAVSHELGLSSSSPRIASSGSYSSSSGSATSPVYPNSSSGNIGLSAGGAKDISNFRENIENDFLPLPTDITYEGLYYDYYFDTGMLRPCNKLFCPSYATAVTRDPISHQAEYYISVGLNSGLRESDFERKLLNLVIVLDISGSMDACFNQYYYDGYTRFDAYEGEGIYRKTKLDSAKEAVVTILNQLSCDDRFAIVVFSSNARVTVPMGSTDNARIWDVEDEIMNLRTEGSTNLDAGMDLARAQFRRSVYLDSDEYENRIIVLTDAQPNTGDIQLRDFIKNVENSAEDRVYTTFIGIGVDFNSQLIEGITKVKGANYYSVRSPREFRRRMEEEFDFMVTPLIFNLRLDFESHGWRIDQVFGSPEADYTTGSLMTINTLFPSKSEGGETKGGLVLLKLRRISSEPDERIYLRMSYEDRNGRRDSSESVVYLEKTHPEYFDNSGIRKGILLTRYAALLKNWMMDERQYYGTSDGWYPCVNEDTGIKIPGETVGQWERQSMSLRVSEPWTRIFCDFTDYFREELKAIGDHELEQELDVINIISYH